MSKMWKSAGWNWRNTYNGFRPVEIYESAKPEIRLCSVYTVWFLWILPQQWERQGLEDRTWRLI